MMDKTTDLMTMARAEATQEVAAAITLAAGEVLLRHGNDAYQYAVSILAAGFVMAIRRIGDNIDSQVPTMVRVMLEEAR